MSTFFLQLAPSLQVGDDGIQVATAQEMILFGFLALAIGVGNYWLFKPRKNTTGVFYRYRTYSANMGLVFALIGVIVILGALLQLALR